MNPVNSEDILLEIKDFREIPDLKRIVNLDELHIDENYLIIRLFPIANSITEYIGPLTSITNRIITFKTYWHRNKTNNEYTEWFKDEPGSSFHWQIIGFTHYPLELEIYSLGEIGKNVDMDNGPNEIIHKLHNEPPSLQYSAFKAIPDEEKDEVISFLENDLYIKPSNITRFKRKGGKTYKKQKTTRKHRKSRKYRKYRKYRK